MECGQMLREYLDKSGVAYTVQDHPQAFTAQEVADRAHVSGRQFAKTVMVKLDGAMAMAVLPAANKVNFNLLREASGAEVVELATEREFSDRFPDCNRGAMPPFGNIYGMRVFVAGSLAEQDEITFTAGDHTTVVTLAYADYEDIVRPEVARFSFRRELKAFRAEG